MFLCCQLNRFTFCDHDECYCLQSPWLNANSSLKGSSKGIQIRRIWRQKCHFTPWSCFSLCLIKMVNFWLSMITTEWLLFPSMNSTYVLGSLQVKVQATCVHTCSVLHSKPENCAGVTPTPLPSSSIT